MDKSSDEKNKNNLKKGLLIKMSPEIHTQFKVVTTQNGTDMTSAILDFIKNYIKKNIDDKKDM